MICPVSVRTVRNFLVRHWIFSIAFLAGAAIRVITMLGFPPAIWYGGDSASYLNSGLHWWPGTSRESGYGVMLGLLRPLHSFGAVTAVQHLMGLATAVMIYALLRHRYNLPAWGATLATLPVLLDVYVIQLEQEILADGPFTFLAVAAVTLILWWPDKRPAWASAAAAALLGIASTFWPVGLPLLIVLLAFMILRRVGWRALTATALAGAVPLAMYLGWYDFRYHRVAFNQSTGVFLWSRTMTFADCAVIKPPADLRPLCPTQPVADRPTAPFYIWETNSPLLSVGGTGPGEFTVRRNALAQKFAVDAIKAQPLAYADAVLHGFLLTFHWNRPAYPSAVMASRYQFTVATQDWADPDVPGRTTARALATEQRAYTGGYLAPTREVQPFADFMISYQRWVYLRGTIIGLLMLIGLGGIVRSWRGGGFRRLRGWGGPAFFPWLTALTMMLVPPVTAAFSLRYVVPTIPVVCLAAALAFARPRSVPDTGLAAGALASAVPAAGAPATAAAAAPAPASAVPAEPDRTGTQPAAPAEAGESTEQSENVRS
jgi:hypothetical protein